MPLDDSSGLTVIRQSHIHLGRCTTSILSRRFILPTTGVIRSKVVTIVSVVDRYAMREARKRRIIVLLRPVAFREGV